MLVRKLIYLSHTRHEIAFVITVVSQHMHSQIEAHFETVYKILKYLNGQLEKVYSSRKMKTIVYKSLPTLTGLVR